MQAFSLPPAPHQQTITATGNEVRHSQQITLLLQTPQDAKLRAFQTCSGRILRVHHSSSFTPACFDHEICSPDTADQGVPLQPQQCQRFQGQQHIHNALPRQAIAAEVQSDQAAAIDQIMDVSCSLQLVVRHNKCLKAGAL